MSRYSGEIQLTCLNRGELVEERQHRLQERLLLGNSAARTELSHPNGLAIFGPLSKYVSTSKPTHHEATYHAGDVVLVVRDIRGRVVYMHGNAINRTTCASSKEGIHPRCSHKRSGSGEPVGDSRADEFDFAGEWLHICLPRRRCLGRGQVRLGIKIRFVEA